MSRPFRFWCSAPPPEVGRSARAIGEYARRAEGLGYDAIVIPDHLLDMLAPAPFLAAVAARTERIRVGTFVFNNDLRNPAVLAHELISLDLLSEGRLIAGLGAGWNRPEYEVAGIAFDSPGTRIGRLEATIDVVRGAFGGRAPFEKYPRPHRARLPILVGGGGRRLLTLAAREADIVGLAPRVTADSRADYPTITAAATDQKLAWIREAAGNRVAELDLNTYSTLRGGFRVTDDPKAVAAELVAAVAANGGRLSAEEILESPHTLLGPVDAIVDKARAMRERWGINCFMVGAAIDDFAPVVSKLS